jgi:hypothetical protein
MNQPTTAEQNAFYDAAVWGLHGLDALGRGQPRLDSEALARWQQFKGELIDADLIDLLVRDAAVDHPSGFAPRAVFALPSLAEDEPFGAEWPGIEPALAARLLRRELWEFSIPAVLETMAETWGLRPGPVQGDLEGIQPSSRVIVGGIGALWAAVRAFVGPDHGPRQGFDFADQVLVVTDRPGERQLAGLAAALLGSAKTAQLRMPGEVRGFRAERVISSADASAAVLRSLNDYRAQL